MKQQKKIWFTSDTHFSHKNILTHSPNRAKVGAFNTDDLLSHDKWLIEKWNKTVAKNDIVYIIGDFSFAPSECVKKLCGKLNGKKYLIVGNHDKSSEKLEGYFKDIKLIKCVTFKKCHFDFLEEDFQVCMCHYAMVVWPSKHYGCVQVCGHSHGRLDEFNEESTDLRVDVGWDSKLGNYDLVSLEKLYKYFKLKTNGQFFRKYAIEMKESKEMNV